MCDKYLDGELDVEIEEVAEIEDTEIIDRATDIAIKAGYKTIKSDLDKKLRKGEINKAQYDTLLPYNRAHSITAPITYNITNACMMDGTKLKSKVEIAQYLVDRLLTEDDEFFAFEMNRIFKLDGVEYCEFRCYKY